jgi:hypothetical protein
VQGGSSSTRAPIERRLLELRPSERIVRAPSDRSGRRASTTGIAHAHIMSLHENRKPREASNSADRLQCCINAANHSHPENKEFYMELGLTAIRALSSKLLSQQWFRQIWVNVSDRIADENQSSLRSGREKSVASMVAMAAATEASLSFPPVLASQIHTRSDSPINCIILRR